jgi:hypothetical protein
MVFLAATGAIRSEQTLLVLFVGLVLVAFVAVVRWLAGRLRQFQGIEIYGGRDLGIAILAGVMMMFAQGCFFFQITPFFWNVQQVGDIEGALRFVPWVIGLIAGGMLVARLALRFGARRILVFSFLASGVALFAMSFVQVDSPFWVMIVPITLLGLSAGLSGPARTTVVMSAPPEGLVNSSAAVNTAAVLPRCDRLERAGHATRRSSLCQRADGGRRVGADRCKHLERTPELLEQIGRRWIPQSAGRGQGAHRSLIRRGVHQWYGEDVLPCCGGDVRHGSCRVRRDATRAASDVGRSANRRGTGGCS